MPQPSIHEDLTRTLDSEGLSDRSTGFWIAAILVLAGVLPMVRHHPPKFWAFPAAILILLVSVAAPRALHPINWGLTRLGLLMSRVTNPIVMAVLFYVIFTPVGALIRMMGKDPLNVRFDPKAASYWKLRTPPGPPAETIANPF
jgi:hypothetical protein